MSAETRSSGVPPAGESQPPVQRPGAFSALRHRNFQLYFSGQLISVAGTWMQVIAQGWLVYQISHSELILGVVGFASAIPALILSPFGGVVVDRVSKRSLLVATQAFAMLLAFTLAWLAFSDRVQEWHIIVLAACTGIFNAFDAPARQAFVVEMVGREDLTNAIALNSMMFNAARVIGPALAGVLLALLGAAWCFLINGISFFFVIAGLLLMRLPPHPRHEGPISPWSQLRQGWEYVTQRSELSGLILIALVFSFFSMSYSSILPAFVDRALHQDASAYGWINALTGMGAVTGAIILAGFSHRIRRGRWLLAATLLFPVTLMLFAINTRYGLALLLSYGLGVGFMLQFTLVNTLLQLRVTDAMRGRVMALYTITFSGFAPFGNLLTGWLAEQWGLAPAIVFGALMALLLTLALLQFIPSLRRLDEPHGPKTAL